LYGGPVTAAVGGELWVVAPSAFDAVTDTEIVESTSSGLSAYVGTVAPAIGLQFWPVASHRRHWNPYVAVGFAIQLPVLAVSSEPTDAVPETDGGAVSSGL
jgi:hypothetical protein